LRMGGLTKDGQFERTDIWREGKWLDLWSVVHLLSGVSVGIGLPIFKFDAASVVLIALLGFIAYELWEAVVKIEETPQNRVMDVVLGMVTFLPLCFITFDMTVLARLSLFAPVLTINILLAVVGWYTSSKADALEASLRAKFIKRRERREQKKARRLAMREAQQRRGHNQQLTKAPQEVS
jgi:hypothetical protein